MPPDLRFNLRDFNLRDLDLVIHRPTLNARDHDRTARCERPPSGFRLLYQARDLVPTRTATVTCLTCLVLVAT